ncbi:MMPL family transporter [Coraliomargarita sp. W4R72]
MKSRALASVFLFLLFFVSAGWLLSLDWKARLSTDVMELIPDRSSSPELSLGRSVLNDIYANRVMIALRSVEDVRAVEAYVATLEASPLVERVINLSSADAFKDVGQFVYQHRFELLFPQWLSTVGQGLTVTELEELVVQRLDAALNDPGFVAFEELVPSDPLLLMRDAAEAFQTAQPAKAVGTDTYLLEVTLTVSALKPEGQLPVFDLLAQAEQNAAAYSPSIRVLDTGAHRYAWETEKEMRQEVQALNISTALVVFLICALLCRRVFLVVHVFVILVVSLVAGLALMMCFFDQVHVFALIFGCVLCGVIVDYGLHGYLHDAGRGRRRLHSFLKPFLISCGSTLMGFSILLLSELPVLRQMGLLVVCGLSMAIVVTLIYVFAVLGDSPQAPPLAGKLRSSKSGTWIVLCFAVLALGALPFVHWEDDISHLKYPLPHLDAVDAEIRNLHGGERVVLLTVGEDYASSRASLDQLTQWLEHQGARPTDTLSAAAWVPTFVGFTAGQQLIANHPDFAERVLRELDQAGYDAEAFAPFERDWNVPKLTSYEDLVSNFSEVLAGGLSGIVGSNEDLHWWVTLVDASVALGEIPADLNSLRLSQVESMSSVLASYRVHTLELSLLGGAAIYAILLFTFGWKDGTRIVFVPVVAVVSSVAAIYFIFGTLGIFHLIGLFLGACLVLDYSVFSWIGFVRSREIPFSVIVSAFTTAASFGILCWSRIPAIHSLGLAVFSVTLIGALSTYLLIPNIAGKQKDGNVS